MIGAELLYSFNRAFPACSYLIQNSSLHRTQMTFRAVQCRSLIAAILHALWHSYHED
jgi:hypothetical protein